MKVLVVGGGKVGRNLAEYLIQQQHTVMLIEKREHVVQMLTTDLQTVKVIEGDGCDPSLLRSIGTDLVDAVAAVTGDDEDNLVVSLLAKREFRVRRVAARVNNPKNAWLFSSRMGVDVPLDTSKQIARGLEVDLNLGAFVSLTRLREGKATLLELTVAPQSHAVDTPVSGLQLPPECVLVAILRGETVLIPAGDTRIMAGDQVIAITRIDNEGALAERFQ